LIWVFHIEINAEGWLFYAGLLVFAVVTFYIPSITTKPLPQTHVYQALAFWFCVGAIESAQHNFPRTPLKTFSNVVLKPSLHSFEAQPEAWILGREGHVFRAGRGSKGGNIGGLEREWGKPLGVRERRRGWIARMAV